MRDQTETREAITELTTFVQRYPDEPLIAGSHGSGCARRKDRLSDVRVPRRRTSTSDRGCRSRARSTGSTRSSRRIRSTPAATPSTTTGAGAGADRAAGGGAPLPRPARSRSSSRASTSKRRRSRSRSSRRRCRRKSRSNGEPVRHDAQTGARLMRRPCCWPARPALLAGAQAQRPAAGPRRSPCDGCCASSPAAHASTRRRSQAIRDRRRPGARRSRCLRPATRSSSTPAPRRGCASASTIFVRRVVDGPLHRAGTTEQQPSQHSHRRLGHGRRSAGRTPRWRRITRSLRRHRRRGLSRAAACCRPRPPPVAGRRARLRDARRT